jgi:hypothetical protein
VSYYVYIMSGKSGVLYIGATNHLDPPRDRAAARANRRLDQKVPSDATDLRRAIRSAGKDGRARAAAQGMDQEQEARADSQLKSRNGGLRAEDRARSIAPAASAQDDGSGQRTITDGEFDLTNLRVTTLEAPSDAARSAGRSPPRDLYTVNSMRTPQARAIYDRTRSDRRIK